MSIRNRMKTYILSECTTTEGALNEEIETYEPLVEIKVSISFSSASRREGDIRFTGCDYSGLTDFKGLDPSKKYRLAPLGHDGVTFDVASINELSRFSQYILKAVIL